MCVLFKMMLLRISGEEMGLGPEVDKGPDVEKGGEGVRKNREK